MTKKERGREAARRYRQRHPDRVRESQRKWKQLHKDVLRVYRHKYYMEHRDEELQRCRRWYEAHPEYQSQQWQRRRKANPDYARERDARRRARKLGVHAEPVRRLEIAERDGWRCHLCRGKIKPTDLALDHLIPLSAGGAHAPHNVAAAHGRCNARRGAGWIPAQLRLLG